MNRLLPSAVQKGPSLLPARGSLLKVFGSVHTDLNWTVTIKHFLTSCIVPDAVVGELHSVRMLGFLKVLVGMSANVAATADVAADQTDPQVLQKQGKRF